MKQKILLVEDEADLTTIIADTLRGEGYEVVTARDGKEGLERFRAEGPALTVADVMMPRMDGFEMARRMRAERPDAALLFLTARSAIDDIEEGFDIGAGDYLKKPFELRELIVRIKALLRRGSAPQRRFQIGEYTYDAANQTLEFRGEETEVSNIEARLLTKLAENMGRTVDASELMIAVWQRDDLNNRNSLHAYIHKLRRALRHDPGITIVNQRGFGYMLRQK